MSFKNFMDSTFEARKGDPKKFFQGIFRATKYKPPGKVLNKSSGPVKPVDPNN